MDGALADYEAVLIEIEVAAGTLVAPHSHPGVESTYVLEGSGGLRIEGLSPRLLRAGDGFQVTPVRICSVQIGDRMARVCSTLVARKGEPLVLPATPRPWR
jgi:quercetin dioxygenase-like cupin family protein